MTERERNRHELSAKLYMRSLTDRQLDGVIDAETDRLTRCTRGEVADLARIMRRCAMIEKQRRGLV